MTKKLLLSGVFGPFGVDDAYGRKENVMELFHNQVTKAQGPASLRFHHRSFGLYFLAENVDAPVTVLDFPSKEQFVAELRRQRYDAVGISFIAPNFVKAREMARLVREIQPDAEIILGGHGAAIEGVEARIPCDHVVRGEGIRWLRRYLGEPECRPIRHPSLVAAEHKRIYGIPTPGVAGLLVPGVGCVNGCRFCATTHFFGKKYAPFFSTGEELYRTACKVADDLGTDDLFVMDENFLKDADRARGLLACMERDRRPLHFAVFSSAEAVEAFGVENMARLGVYFVWIGAESKRETYEKNKGRDLHAIVQDLRAHGIAVLVSGILFLEHHTPQNIWEDIDFIIELGGDFTQFMMFTPLPVTRLYEDYKQKGLIDFDLPFEEWHGQNLLNWRHPHFTREQARRILDEAFRAEFDRLSASTLRMAQTYTMGYMTLAEQAKRDPWMAMRREKLRERAQELRLLVPTMYRFAHNELERANVARLHASCEQAFGPWTLRDRALAFGARALAEAHAIRSRWLGDLDQPAFRLQRYRWPDPAPRAIKGSDPPLRQPAWQRSAWAAAAGSD